MKMTQRGNYGETLARGYLEGLGFIFLEANYRIKGGEIDLIMRDGEALVFVEVKYRSTEEYGSGIESIGRGKQSFLRRAAYTYLMKRGLSIPWRIDVVEVTATGGGPIFLHLKFAVGAN